MLNREEDLLRQILRNGSTLVYKTLSAYQNIYVTEQSEFEGMQGKFRLLQFTPDVIQGIMNMEQPDYLVHSYSRITVDLIDYYAWDFNRGFILGHGIGTLSSYYPDKYLLTAEIDPMIVEVSKKYFGHSGKNVVVGDGLAHLKTLETQSQDIIFLDAYSGNKIPFHLTTNEFFSLTNEKLSDKGILIVNYIGKLRYDRFLYQLYSTISGIYPYVKVFAVSPKKRSKQNIFFVASRHLLEDYSPREAIPIQIIR
jgi:spermidine synthase